MKSGLFVAIAIFITVYITVLDIVFKCQIVNGTSPYRHADVCHIRCHIITLLHTSIEMCVCITCTCCPCTCQIRGDSIGHFYM